MKLKKIFLCVIVCTIIFKTIPAFATEIQSVEGRWMTGEYHTHTRQSNDATSVFMVLENLLKSAFREGTLPDEARASLNYGKHFDYIMFADHLRNSVADPDGNIQTTARYVAIEEQQNKIKQLQSDGKYNGKPIYSGFEWDMMGLDHASVAIIESNNDNVPIDAIHEFEWLYSYDSKDNVFNNNEEVIYGSRQNDKNDKQKAFDAIEWIKRKYPESFVLLNHPSRHNGNSSGVVTVEDLRKMNDIAPNIVFGMEGMPGNQMAASANRAELSDVYGGADIIIAKVGGIWDSMLGEGRRFWNFTNNDFHFKISADNKYSSGYWPSEYSRNYTWVNGNTFKDVVNGMRSGNSFSVYGDIIDALDFSASSKGNIATMGSELSVIKNDMVDITIRFKSPEFNNYEPISAHESEVNNKVEVDHIDLISGEVTGKLDEANYSKDTNETTKVIARFDKEDWGNVDTDGYYTIIYQVPADTDRYYRLRGTNLGLNVEGYTDIDGNPLQDKSYDYNNTPTPEENEERFNNINDRNYTGLWFYSNPIFINTTDEENLEEVLKKAKEVLDNPNATSAQIIEQLKNLSKFMIEYKKIK